MKYVFKRNFAIEPIANVKFNPHNNRYRYLRMKGKATSEDFAHLDSMFVSHRNPKVIHQLEQKVIDYEQALQRQTELLIQQKRIQQEQGELKKYLGKL